MFISIRCAGHSPQGKAILRIAISRSEPDRPHPLSRNSCCDSSPYTGEPCALPGDFLAPCPATPGIRPQGRLSASPSDFTDPCPATPGGILNLEGPSSVSEKNYFILPFLFTLLFSLINQTPAPGGSTAGGGMQNFLIYSSFLASAMTLAWLALGTSS